MLHRPAPAADVVVEEVGGQVCLLQLATNDVVVLNQTASDIFLLATEGLSTDVLISRLARSYNTTASDIADDVTTTLNDLLARGFLVETDQ